MSHDPGYAQTQRQNIQHGAASSAEARKTLAPQDLELAFADRASLQATIEAMFRLEILGQLPSARSRQIIRFLSLAVRNFDAPARESHLSGSTASHLPRNYQGHAEAIHNNLEDIAEQLKWAEILRRRDEIGEVQSKREVILAANEQFDVKRQWEADRHHVPTSRSIQDQLAPFRDEYSHGDDDDDWEPQPNGRYTLKPDPLEPPQSPVPGPQSFEDAIPTKTLLDVLDHLVKSKPRA